MYPLVQENDQQDTPMTPYVGDGKYSFMLLLFTTILEQPILYYPYPNTTRVIKHTSFLSLKENLSRTSGGQKKLQ